MPHHLKMMYFVVVLLAVFVIVLLCIKPASSVQQKDAAESNDLKAGESSQTEEALLFADAQASGAFAYEINPVVTLEDGQLDLQIKNLSAGEYGLQVDITISGGDYDGQAVYKTGVIVPSYGVGFGKILEALPEGLYGALAEIHAIDMGTEQSIGSISAAVVIHVPAAAPTPSPTPSPTPLPTLTPELQDADGADPEETPAAGNTTTPTGTETGELSVVQMEELLGITPNLTEDEP